MSSSNQAPARKSRGRQKVPMVKMTNPIHLQVTFSKRRASLFKKASELCTLCGSEAAIVTFSPANKVFCFGHPSVQTVIDNFEQLNLFQPAEPTDYSNARSQVLLEAHRNSTILELNMKLTLVEGLLKAEKRHTEELDLEQKSGRVEGWFYPSFDGLDYEQLSVLKESVMGLKNNLDVKVQNEMFALSNPLPVYYPPDAGYMDAVKNNVAAGYTVDAVNNNVAAGYMDAPDAGYMDAVKNNAAAGYMNAVDNNAQLALGFNDFINPNYNQYPSGYSGNIDLLGGHQVNNGLIDHPSSIISGQIPNADYQNGGEHMHTNFASSSQGFNSMAFDPRF